jgi:hypothetical protein
MLGFEAPNPASDYHALLDPEQSHPLTWLSLESVKSPGRAPEGCSAFVAQLGARTSLQSYSMPDESIVSDVCGYLARLYGEGYRTPVVHYVKRWKYSQPESFCQFESVNRQYPRLLLAGDGLLGPRAELAYETGLMAAERCAEFLHS